MLRFWDFWGYFSLNHFHFWISFLKATILFLVLVFGKISLLIHFILAFLAGMIFLGGWSARIFPRTDWPTFGLIEAPYWSLNQPYNFHTQKFSQQTSQPELKSTRKFQQQTHQLTCGLIKAPCWMRRWIESEGISYQTPIIWIKKWNTNEPYLVSSSPKSDCS